MNKQPKFCFLLILLLSTLGILPCAAQQYFNKRYTLNSANNLLTNVLQKNNKYYGISGCLDSINYIGSGMFKNTNGLKFVVFDNAGNITASKLFQRDDKALSYVIGAGIAPSNNLIAMSDGTFLFAFGVIDTAVATYNPSYLNIRTNITRFDSLGNVLMYKEYDRAYCYTTDATNHILTDFKPDAHGNWLMLSTMLCNGNKIVFNLRKLDSTFNEIWVKNFTTSSNHNTPKHLLIEDDGYVMTGGIDNGNMMLHPNYYSSVLIKCDTAGNKLWDWQNTFDTTKLQYSINDIIRSKDGGYVYCGTGEGVPMYFDAKADWSGIRVKSWVEKLDAARKSVWKRSIGLAKASIKATEQTVLKELPDGDIIVAGSTVDLFDIYDETDGWIRGSLTRLSGVDGSIKWQRLYKSPDGNDTMYLSIYDMRQTADGGYILAGESKNGIDRGVGPTQRGWLIKVDSNGCEWAGSPCNPTDIKYHSLDSATCVIYPNPSDGDFMLDFNSTNKSSAQLSVFDLMGRQLMLKNIPVGTSTIFTKEWATGIYFYRLSQNDKLVQSGKLIKK